MGKNRKLLIAWMIFLLCLLVFLIVTKLCYDSQKEGDLLYQYRIIVDENIKNINQNENQSDVLNNLREIPDINEDIVDREISEQSYSENKINAENSSVYEKVSCGYIPKISPDGGSVLDVYSAKFNETDVNNKEIKNLKKLGLIILLDYDSSLTCVSEIIKQLEKNKVTFVIPQYAKNLSDITDAIIKSENEFLLQIPTQSSVLSKENGDVALFFANMNNTDLINKLHQLFASAKGAIGIANTSPTLFTKSSKDMNIISEELSKRGLIFLDLEKTNEVMQKIASETPELLYINVSNVFQSQMNEKDILISGAISIFEKDFRSFMIKFNKLNERSKKEKYILAPITAMLKK